MLSLEPVHGLVFTNPSTAKTPLPALCGYTLNGKNMRVNDGWSADLITCEACLAQVAALRLLGRDPRCEGDPDVRAW